MYPFLLVLLCLYLIWRPTDANEEINMNVLAVVREIASKPKTCVLRRYPAMLYLYVPLRRGRHMHICHYYRNVKETRVFIYLLYYLLLFLKFPFCLLRRTNEVIPIKSTAPFLSFKKSISS